MGLGNTNTGAGEARRLVKILQVRAAVCLVGCGTPMRMLDGRVAVITGATGGIGARTAELFVAEGARVVLAGRRVERGRSWTGSPRSRSCTRRTGTSGAGRVSGKVVVSLVGGEGIEPPASSV